jgi:hypothetical protein
MDLPEDSDRIEEDLTEEQDPTEKMLAIRKRGRPRGAVKAPILIPCPFAAAGRENPCTSYPTPVDKAKVVLKEFYK